MLAKCDHLVQEGARQEVFRFKVAYLKTTTLWRDQGFAGINRCDLPRSGEVIKGHPQKEEGIVKTAHEADVQSLRDRVSNLGDVE